MNDGHGALSFGNNGEDYGTAFIIPQNKKYRLATNVRKGKLSIISFCVSDSEIW